MADFCTCPMRHMAPKGSAAATIVQLIVIVIDGTECNVIVILIVIDSKVIVIELLQNSISLKIIRPKHSVF